MHLHGRSTRTHMARIRAELVRPDVTGPMWGGYTTERMRIAFLARAIEVRLPYLHSCTSYYCMKNRTTCRPFLRRCRALCSSAPTSITRNKKHCALGTPRILLPMAVPALPGLFFRGANAHKRTLYMKLGSSKHAAGPSRPVGSETGARFK